MDFKIQKSNNKNLIFVVCCNCGGLFEEELYGVNRFYDSVVCCPFCSHYNNI
jgi:hypothetical protein